MSVGCFHGVTLTYALSGDKRIVDNSSEEYNNEIWWGKINHKLSPESFQTLKTNAINYLSERDELFVVDGYAGWDPEYRVKVPLGADD